MSEVMKIIDEERKKIDVSAEQFAHESGVTVTTYSRHKNGRQALGVDAIQGYARTAKKWGNTAILTALGAYALGLSPDELIIKPNEPAG